MTKKLPIDWLINFTRMSFHSFISTYLYRMTISVIVVTAINMDPVFTSRPTLFE